MHTAVGGAGASIEVEGFTDDTPIHNASFADNIALSQARAEVVAALIRSNLAGRDVVEPQGLGDAQPLGPNDAAEGRSRNRRVEVVLRRGG